MKKLGLFIVILSFVITSCGGYSDRRYNDTVPISNSNVLESENTENDSIDRIQNFNSLKESLPELKNFKTAYKFTDENGTNFEIYIKRDGSVIIINDNGRVYYCTTFDYSVINGGLEIKPSGDEIYIAFPGGYEKIGEFQGIQIKGNWVYAPGNHSQSNNPNWRLPIEKLKHESK